ncbi:TetM/TetW/TetO/TetS family tetracycline resistance ribosomal protection protein [Actinokineospora sp. NBRC 105648]|uniref:elongation factor G n=1 Tax=Actinokineospora sp. NBRC 105648 TaxID=3032206 RepID=UPI0024A1F3A2|nr:TetM/TetW/TetO/TetS family tetracycline resistance ribosomal protection protein [Actinokineospora sp. NBRC 105648]GLZ38120.1 tetracycline resistance protein, tetM/tetO subfamily [Actinokineospora sp. NBRC 105648]
MTVLNLGILAHVDAGKTSLTERLLHRTGVIDEVGSVDEGSTQTDTMELERRRGITIRSAVASFSAGGRTVNLIDTPGHSDFIAEVERVLGVLDGAVLVISAVEGVQGQTRVLARALRRLGIPTLLFVNKLDRRGADPDRVLRGIAEKLGADAVPMGAASGPGTPAAAFTPYRLDDPVFAEPATDLLTRADDRLLAAAVRGGGTADPDLLLRALAEQTASGAAHPVYFGSAITGAGVDALLDGIAGLLPVAGGEPGNPASGTVFKIERGPAGERIAHVRMFDGTLRVRDRVRLRTRAGARVEDRVTALTVFDRGVATRSDALVAGQIGTVRGLANVRVGDPVGDPAPGASADGEFPPPTLETVVSPVDPADRGAAHAALSLLAEQDPLINLRHDGVREEIALSLYGEVQKEVIEATLAEEHGVAVTFAPTTTICLERPTGSGSAVELIGVPPNPFLATVGLRVDPAPTGSGVVFGLGVELGSMPAAFFRAVEESVRATLAEGLCGWRVRDCAVTMTHSGYWARQSHSHGTFDKSMSSTAGDFRDLAPLVLMAALREAGTTVHEPVDRFRLELPPDAVDAVLPVLTRLGGIPDATEPAGSATVVTGVLPAARVHELRVSLPSLTRGEGLLEAVFDHHRPVTGEAPRRARTDDNPLNREEYLLRTLRRV